MSEEINLSRVPTEDLLAEVFSRHKAILMSLCLPDEQGELRIVHHYHGALQILISECELLKDEILEGHREAVKKIRRNIPHPGGLPR